MLTRRNVAAATLAALFVACGGEGGTSGATEPPNSLTYAANPAVYVMGTVIVPNTPSNAGGAVASYSVSPALPAGLSLNTSTGIVGGTPTAITATASYTVTATNASGTTTAILSITVNPPPTLPPSNLAYSTNPAVYTVETAIGPNTPSSGGGAVASYSVSPALPAGLSLNATTGVIVGTPTAVTATANYTVTATNAGGTTTAILTLTVDPRTGPPSTLTYSTNPAVYRVGTAITPNTPSSGGSAVVSYSVSPSLPAGLSLDASTGVIGGTPTAVTSTATYTVTATNSAGSTTAILSITVNPPPTAPGAPSGVVATADIRSASVSWVAPASDGGSPITGYTVYISPPTPAAFVTVTGTAASVAGLANGASYAFTVAASNAVGTGPASSPSDPVSTPDLPGAPTNLGAVAGDRSASLTWTAPGSTGGRSLTGYTVFVSPAAPSAVFSVTGTTAMVTGLANEVPYTFRVYATTTVGSGPVSDPSPTVTPTAPPTNLTYATNPVAYTLGTAIAPNTPSSSGGSVVIYSVSPALPPGLNLNALTGAISGTPTAITSIASYTVTATNAGGSATVSLSITVNPPAPPTITLQPMSQTVYVGQTATFRVTASGTGPLGYQWYRNGSAIYGATDSSYTTAHQVQADSGAAYSVTATDQYGGTST